MFKIGSLLLLIYCFSRNVAATLITLTGENVPAVDKSDINNFLRKGAIPSNLTTTMEFPTFLSSTIVIVLNPLLRIFDTAEVKLLEDGLEFFYQQIFTSQTEFDITLRAVSVVGQSIHEVDATLNLESLIDINFKPSDENQELTKVEFHNVLLNLLNHFQPELIRYLKQVEHDPFPNIEVIQARNPSNYRSNKIMDSSSTSTTKRSISWSYVIGFITTSVVTAALLFACVIYRQKVGSQKYQEAYNISPFKEDIHEEEIDFPDEDDATHNSYNSRFSFVLPVGDGDPPPETDLMASLRHDFSAELTPEIKREKQQLSLDKVATQEVHDNDVDKDSSTSEKEEIAHDDEAEQGTAGNIKNRSRVELWAPAGKLGVAIDIVDGMPVVWRIKSGSPLEGFLQNGDCLLAIDEIDTSSMSAADVTSIMVRRMRQRRKITYLRP